MEYNLIAATTFGLEAVCKREIENLGFEIVKVEDGKITFKGDERAITRSNLYLRSADRVLIKLAEFKASTSEELFQGVKKVDWGKIVPEDGHYIINCTTLKSDLKSVPITQKVTEKAIFEKLKEKYRFDWAKKTGSIYDIKVSILKNIVTLTLDTTGDSLHKRGYRKLNVEAPIKETIAASLVMLSFYKEGKTLIDPCCGSGTIPIEAAMIAKNIAPGKNRKFAFENWNIIDKEIVKEERKRAIDLERKDVNLKIYGYDIDPNAIKVANRNLKEAGLEGNVIFELKDINDVVLNEDYGVIISNPPYGERIGDRAQIERIYEAYKKLSGKNKTWSFFIITSDKKIEDLAFNRPADRRRKLYNGRLEVCFYQYHGTSPKKI